MRFHSKQFQLYVFAFLGAKKCKLANATALNVLKSGLRKEIRKWSFQTGWTFQRGLFRAGFVAHRTLSKLRIKVQFCEESIFHIL